MERKLDPDTSMWDWLTYDLRLLCKKYDLSVNEFARKLQRSPSNASNILAGRRRINDKDAKILDTEYDTGEHYARLLKWARRGHSPSWSQQYVEFEREALVVKTYQALSIPGLLQVPEYARELIKAVGEIPEADIDAEVEHRMARQRIFDKGDPAIIWALITENVIDWPIGGAKVMRKQLAHLLDMASRPNVGVRIVERTAGAHAGVDGSFFVLSGDFGDIAYAESPGAGRLVQATSELRSYGLRYDRISQVASSEKRSQELIQRVMEEL